MEKVTSSDDEGKRDETHSLEDQHDSARVSVSGEQVALSSEQRELVLGVLDSDEFMETYHVLRRARSTDVTEQEFMETSIDLWVDHSNLSQVCQAVGSMSQVPAPLQTPHMELKQEEEG